MINKYILRGILKSISLSIFIFVSILSLFLFLDQSKNLSSADIGMQDLLWFTFFKLPEIFNNTLQMGVIIGFITFISNLSKNNELYTIYFAGISPINFLKKIISNILLLSIILFLLMDSITPYANLKAAQIKSKELESMSNSIDNSRNWFRLDNFFFLIDQTQGDGREASVTKFNFNHNSNTLDFTQASEFRLNDKEIEILNPETINIKQSNFYYEINKKKSDSVKISLGINPNELNLFDKDPKKLSLIQITDQIRLLDKFNQPAKAYIMELILRVLKPINIIVLILIIFPFLSRFSRTTTLSKKISLGILVVFLFDLIMKITYTSLGLLDYALYPLLFLPTIIIFAVGVHLNLKKIT